MFKKITRLQYYTLYLFYNMSVCKHNSFTSETVVVIANINGTN